MALRKKGQISQDSGLIEKNWKHCKQPDLFCIFLLEINFFGGLSSSEDGNIEMYPMGALEKCSETHNLIWKVKLHWGVVPFITTQDLH